MNRLILIAYFTLLGLALLTYGLALKTKESYIRILFLYLVVILATTLLAIFVVNGLKMESNLFLFHIFTPIEYTLIGLLYNDILSGAVVRRAIRISIPVFIVTSILFSLFVQRFRDNNSYIVIIECVLIICWTLLFFREVLLYREAEVLVRYPRFWIGMGILVYFTETMAINGLMDYMVKHSMGLARRAYGVSYIFKYLLFLSLTLGAWCRIGLKRPWAHEGA
jgi:hypothetical protein